ncbi:hypothetical protein SBOR_7254 [Sclerotinia borealis F-4128]|uniref:Uncharacterized protein n=1 Tax=Sclerotinia borealis (strain F-4128) TaxID=1432307 RepID=W9CBZ0_SCLBF|nr:hypothetical protein SBOR_7254 [Sclerotinia borealis F-4128]
MSISREATMQDPASAEVDEITDILSGMKVKDTGVENQVEMMEIIFDVEDIEDVEMTEHVSNGDSSESPRFEDIEDIEMTEHASDGDSSESPRFVPMLGIWTSSRIMFFPGILFLE